VAGGHRPRAKKPSSDIRERVQRAREKKQTRFHSDAKVNCNARMGPRQIKRHCQLTDESQELIHVGDPRNWPLIT
jgi:magnesium chelatase family protein